MNYKDILNSKVVIDEYKKIDEVNAVPFNHGMKHINNVCNIMNRLCDILNISGEQKDALLIAASLHDIGQADGREEHGRKAKEFLIRNFENELKNNKYYNDMLISIEIHDDMSNINNSLFTLLVQLCDKLDFSKERMEENYREKFRYYCWENVDKVEFIYDDDRFGIDIITSNIDNFNELFLSENFTKKIINSLSTTAEKLNRKLVILNNGKTINIEK